MATGGDLRVMAARMGPSHVASVLDSPPRTFKKHKSLPHPPKEDAHRSDRWKVIRGSNAPAQNGGSPAPSYRRQPRQVGSGPEPPPTPPAHSRTSSATRPAAPSSSECAGNPSRSTDNVESRPPATPPNQQTPPTPNLTPDRAPPGPAARQGPTRPPISDRISSKLTTDSRAESFKTARENPYSSDDDDGKSTLRPILSSTRTSQSTVRGVSSEARGKSQAVGLGLGLEPSSGEDITPRTMREFNAFDGEWSREVGANDVEEEWDDNLWRNVTVRKRRPTTSRAARNPQVIEDTTVKPTNATRALRSVSLQESPMAHPSRRVVSEQLPTQTAAPNSESSSSTELKRSSIMSTKSTASTVVEAFLVETAPQRRKTLRHVRKQSALRNSGLSASPASSAPTSVSAAVDDPPQFYPLASRARDAARESHASTATFNSISSRKARRDVWKNGGVPVVVIPERRASLKSSKEPSLRSTSSRRSRSLSSAPASQRSKSKDRVPVFERPSRRSRAFSESDGSRPGDERTMDFPPIIPARSSSLSAPTSRNVSRTGSLTSESLRAHNSFQAQQAQQAHHALQVASGQLDRVQSRTRPSTSQDRSRDRKGIYYPPEVILSAAAERGQFTVVKRASPDEQREVANGRAALGLDHTTPDMNGEHSDDGDPFFGNRLSVQNTPFSVASVETTGTSHAEVSEAMAVNIYPHQSTSVVLVNHTPSSTEPPGPEPFELKVTQANGAAGPVTPPQQFSVDDVDSPLRNPRAPPKPPVINFIPATPSGLTPSVEKERQLGNYHEMTEEKPKRSRSLLRRTFGRGRASEYGPSPARPVGFLRRTLSLSRNVRRHSDWADDDRDRRPRLKRHSTADMPDESRLHPFWRPTYAEDESSEEENDDGDSHEDRTYRYPPIDNRPSKPRRSLSARIKRTFAILPVRDDDRYEDYPATGHDGPDRRTIRRTPSGNLRVMKFRRSMESITGTPPEAKDGRQLTAPEQQQQQQQRQERQSRSQQRSGGDGSEGRYTRLLRSLSSSKPKPRPSDTGPSPAIAAEPGKGSGSGGGGADGGFLPTLGDRMNLTRRLSEKRREKRTQELRGMISGPREVRDGVGDVIRRKSQRDVYAERQQQQQREQQQREQQQQQQREQRQREQLRQQQQRQQQHYRQQYQHHQI